MNHLNQSTHHLLTGSKVGNHAITQWSDSTDIIMSLLAHAVFDYLAHSLF